MLFFRVMLVKEALVEEAKKFVSKTFLYFKNIDCTKTKIIFLFLVSLTSASGGH
jgi:hypothetical protein